MTAGWTESPQAIRAALDHFVDALEGRTRIGPDLAEALKAQAIAEAAMCSLVTAQMEPILYSDAALWPSSRNPLTKALSNGGRDG